MVEKDNAIMIGSALDELVRHHPSLKDQVFEGIQAMFQSIEDQGNAWRPPASEISSYQLLSSTQQPATTDIDVSMAPTPSSDRATTPAVPLPEITGEEGVKKVEPRNESIILSFVDVAVKVMPSILSLFA